MDEVTIISPTTAPTVLQTVQAAPEQLPIPRSIVVAPANTVPSYEPGSHSTTEETIQQKRKAKTCLDAASDLCS